MTSGQKSVAFPDSCVCVWLGSGEGLDLPLGFIDRYVNCAYGIYCVCMCMHVCVRACARVCVCVCVC